MEQKIDHITEAVREDLKKRSEVGIKKYNTTLDENNKDNYFQHLYEELLDAAQYSKKIITMNKEIHDLISKYPNNSELGEQVRKIYGNN